MNNEESQLENDYKTMRQKLIEDNKLTLKAVFVPFSQSRNNGKTAGRDKWESLNWNVTLCRNEREIITTEYSQGVAHCPAYKTMQGWEREQCINVEKESGMIAHYPSWAQAARVTTKRIPAPDVESVLYSLIMDSDVLNSGGFEEWAGELGMDTDSRSSESTYRACLETALKLRAGLGENLLTALREAYQDY